MATVDQAGLVFYPAFCFKASPTHFAWVKMAAADVQRLQRVRGFEGRVPFLVVLVYLLVYALHSLVQVRCSSIVDQ